MTAADLQERIDNIFVQQLHVQPPAADTDLIENGVIDSLSFVDLLAHLEEEFSIRIQLDEVDLNQFRSIERIGNFIRAHPLKAEVSHGSHSAI
jgi:acyl carrier protein